MRYVFILVNKLSHMHEFTYVLTYIHTHIHTWGTRLCNSLRHRSISRKVAGSIQYDITWIFLRYNTSGCTMFQKWVPGICPGGKGGRCVGLTNLPSSCADCLEIWEPQTYGTFRWVDYIRIELQEVECGYMDWIGLAQDRDRWRTLVSAVMNLRVPWNAGNILTGCNPVTSRERLCTME